MKPIILLLILFSFVVISCSSSDDSPTLTNVTYTGDIKFIIDDNCLNCHGNPTANGAPMFLTTYDEVKEAVINRGLIDRIKDGSMPPTGTPLTDLQVQAIKDWKTANYPQ